MGRGLVGLGLACVGLLSGCSGGDDAEADAYAELEGIYELTGVDRYAEACEASGDPSHPQGVPGYWVAYTVTRNVPDIQLHAHGCPTLEQCRVMAEDVRSDGRLDSLRGYDFTQHVYSRVSSDGAIDGVGVTQLGVLDGSCRLVLEQTSIERAEGETRFVERERWGVEYAPAADGDCATRDDLASQWRDWTDHACRRVDVIRTRPFERL